MIRHRQCRLHGVWIAKRYKAKATWLAAVWILHHQAVGNVAELWEVFIQACYKGMAKRLVRHVAITPHWHHAYFRPSPSWDHRRIFCWKGKKEKMSKQCCCRRRRRGGLNTSWIWPTIDQPVRRSSCPLDVGDDLSFVCCRFEFYQRATTANYVFKCAPRDRKLLKLK